MADQEIKGLVDEFTKWDGLMREAKVEIDKIKAQLQQIALPEIENSKIKMVRYFGSSSNVATIMTAETVKMVSYKFLQTVLGAVTGDFIKEETTYKMTDPFKRIVAPLCLGNYTELKMADVISQMDVDDKTAKVLKKKLKGDPQKDYKVLESVGVCREDIEHWVYFIAEAMAYEKIVRLMEVAGYEEGSPGYNKALADLKLAVITEETLKIGIEYEGNQTLED